MWDEEAGTGEGDLLGTPSAHLSFHGQTTGSTGFGRVSEPQFPQIINNDLLIPWSGPKNQSSYPTELPG